MPRATRRLVALAGILAASSAMLLSGASSAGAARIASAKSACSAVSAASVSAIVGFSVPTPSAITNTVAASKANFETSSVDTGCAYGAETSTAAFKKLILLDSDTESKAITSSEFTAVLKQQQTHAIGLKVVPYSGLGVPGFYYSATFSGIYFQGIAGIAGKHLFGAAVYTKSVSQSKLAALAKLAEKI